MDKRQSLEKLKKTIQEKNKGNNNLNSLVEVIKEKTSLESLVELVAVLNAVKSGKEIGTINDNLKDLREILDRIEQKEFPQPKEFPTSIEVSNLIEPPQEIEVKNLSDIKFPTSIEVENLHKIKFPESVDLKEPKWLFSKMFGFFESAFKELKAKIEGVKESNLDRYTKKTNPLAVKLVSVDGKFYNAGGGGGGSNIGHPNAKFAFANIAASTTDGNLVSAVTGKSIRVLSFRIHAGGTATNVTFNTKPASAGSAISELFAAAANGGHHGAYSPIGHFETRPGEGLTVTTGTGSTVGIGVVYSEI